MAALGKKFLSLGHTTLNKSMIVSIIHKNAAKSSQHQPKLYYDIRTVNPSYYRQVFGSGENSEIGVNRFLIYQDDNKCAYDKISAFVRSESE